ncbi:MAG: TIGR03619 family F420-dependent LLM class oxidoreductase [Chloroflexi bacterium]|nr:TIGR03619 family F420-dependent LLM class oxidoreductase [Chloroflexota bacterium]
MKFGIGLTNYGLGVAFDDLRRVALTAERLGYVSIWTTDHLLVPKKNIEPYGNIFESVTTLAMMGALTDRLQLGTSVLVLPMRNPVLVAKQMATLDAASHGRTILGVGVGWNAVEYANLGASFRDRGRRLDEAITLMRTMWSQNEVTFHGKYTNIENGYSSPLPARKSGIPIWIGGDEEPSLRRVANLGDGWHPVGASPETIAAGIKRIRELKPARPITVSARLSIDLNSSLSPTYEYRNNPRHRLVGSVDGIRARLREYAQAGVEHMVLFFPEIADKAIAQMEQFANELRPEFI